MSNIFKKALGLFVEFDPEQPKTNSSWGDDGLPIQVKTQLKASNGSTTTMSQIDFEKFEKHFEDLFDKANLPGPDYYEFWKMMETLESAVPDERTRMAAVYSTLKIQGLTKETLISSAEQYQKVLDKDKLEFSNAVNSKVLAEIEGRKDNINAMEKKNADNAALIQKLTQEISDNQSKIIALKQEVTTEEAKINNNQNGYNIACDAMMQKLTTDIQKIKTSL